MLCTSAFPFKFTHEAFNKCMFHPDLWLFFQTCLSADTWSFITSPRMLGGFQEVEKDPVGRDLKDDVRGSFFEKG